MADHAKPILTDNYTDVLSQIRGRFEDQAKGFDPANTTATNLSTGTIRWNSAEKKFQKWSGTTWGDLTDNYVLSGATFSTGTPNAVAYLNGSKVLTTGSALTFDGTNLGVGTAPVASYRAAINGDIWQANGAGAVIGTIANNAGWYEVAGSNNVNGVQMSHASNARWLIGGSELMRLTSTGLGIGTSSPAAKLDVNGTIRTTSGLDINNATGGTWSQYVATDASLRFYRNADNLILTSSGNLGIGTSSPREKVDAEGNIVTGFQNTFIGAQYLNGASYRLGMTFDAAGRGVSIDSRSGDGTGYIRFTTGGYFERGRIDYAGNFGLGVIPSAWGVGAVIQQGSYMALSSVQGADLSTNGYWNSGWKYLVTGQSAAWYSQTIGGQHQWFTAPSGTAGAPIAFTQAMTLNASGNLGIGTSSPSQKLQVSGNTLVPIGSSYFSYTSDFGFGTPDFDGLQVFAGGGDNLRFGHRTSGAFTERMRLDANGKLILSAANQGIQFADGTTQTTAAINPATASVGAVGTYAFLRGVQAEPGQTYSGAGLHYTGGVVETNSRPVPAGSIWRAMGYTSVADRGTLFLRIS